MLMPSIFRTNVFDDFFEDPFKDFARVPARPQNELMRTDVKELDNGFELSIALPGVKKEDITAEINDGYLTISATTSTDKDEKNADGKYIRRERFYGSAKRSFYVGEDITEEDIKAKYEDGILTLDIPKKEAKPVVEEKKYINIQ
ncbi:MAG TPA: Hsp20/alpha crystallin family protein [Lachnospiraceae bacterium]|nr:Hsp20/alpha crystallin family protein [Lachnospiraceae bacterium]